MEIDDLIGSLDKDVVIFVGNYGSGKTEIAVNFTLKLRECREQVTIVDLDIVNPYFRCREARDIIRSRSIGIVIPNEEQVWADLPIILPEVKGAIANPQGTVVLDVGGDDVGARVLGVFKRAFESSTHELWMVVNTSRPFTETAAGCLRIIGEIERAAKLTATGLVANTHLMDYSTPELVYQGYEVTAQVAEELSIPIVFLAAEEELAGRLERARFDCPIFPLTRYLLPPWKK
ncbi:cobalamin biosynthesis protein CbiA [bacterium]|nr:cobalamin biosynthesis protein CbiA [candidate division CSSED10-310 bacterium]